MVSLSMNTLSSLLEALIFASKEPIGSDKMLETLLAAGHEFSLKDIKSALKKIEEAWANPLRTHGLGFTLRRIAQAYAFVSIPEHAEEIKKLIEAKPIELSKAQSEVLAIVAYRQPLTRVDIDEIRGVDSSSALKKLMQVKLLKILGKSEGLGRPLLYGTTREFLEFFALNSLNDLPSLKHYESLSSNEEEGSDEHKDVTFKDLFIPSDSTKSEVERLSEEALESLDNALNNIENVEKSTKNKII
jgi:segregation and condensation protein B